MLNIVLENKLIISLDYLFMKFKFWKTSDS